METFNEARTTRGETPYYSNEKIMGTKLGLDPYVYPNVDWYDMLFKDCTFNQNFNFNMTGGAKKIDYFLNASVYNENGIMRKPEASKFDTNINAQKYLFQANVSADATKTTRVSLKMNTQLHYRHAPIQSVSDLFAYAMTGMPCEFPATCPARNRTRSCASEPTTPGTAASSPTPTPSCAAATATSFAATSLRR